jgi:hypothetical protein
VRATIALLVVLLGFLSSLHAAAEDSNTPSGERYEAKEHYRFNLGGPSGQYTDWERYDLDRFEGLTTTITIDKTYGKPSDKWASMARIIFFGPGTDKDRRRLSLLIVADRKDGSVEAAIDRGKDKPHEAFDARMAVGKQIAVTIVPLAPGKLLVSIDKANYEVPYDLDIRGIGVVGSGVDVKFEPFNLLKRKTTQD